MKVKAKNYEVNYVQVCRNCKGVGKENENSLYFTGSGDGTCTVCNGGGRVAIKKEIKISINPLILS